MSNRATQLAAFFERSEQCVGDSSLKCRVPRLINKPESGIGAPPFRQQSCCYWRANDVMTALNDLGRQMLYPMKILENMVWRKKTVIDEVMRLKTRHTKRRFSAHMANT